MKHFPVGALVKARKKKPSTSGFDVYSDADAGEVALLREDRRVIDAFVGRGGRLKLPLDLIELPEEPEGLEDTARVVAVIVRDALASYWTQLKAVDIVVGEFAEELDGEDPLRPVFREHLDGALSRVEKLKDELLDYVGDWELPDDHDEALSQVRMLVDRVLG